MLEKGKQIQDPKYRAEQTAGHVTDRLTLRSALISAHGRLRLQFLLSNARWNDWPDVATELAGGAVAPGPTLNFAITLSLAERLVGPGRA